MGDFDTINFGYRIKSNDTKEKYILIFYTTSSTIFLDNSECEHIRIIEPNDKISETKDIQVHKDSPGVLFAQLQWIHTQEGWTGDCNLSLQHVMLNKTTEQKLTFLSGEITVKVKINAGSVITGPPLDAVLGASSAETTAYSDAMDKFINRSGRKPMIPPGAKYGESFARTANLFAAMMGTNVHPAAFFHKKWTIEDEVLENLANLALNVTMHYDGRPLIADVVISGGRSADDRAMNAVLLSRFLAMYANCQPYLSDVEKRKGGEKYEIGEWFGDMILNQAGDCEDASRVACQVWYALKNYSGKNTLVTALQQISEFYDFYAALCTVLHLDNMAHMTAFLLRKDRKGDLPPLLIVEGTNMVDPFAGINGAPNSIVMDNAYVNFCGSMNKVLGSKFLKLIPKPRQTTITKGGNVVEGRAGGKKKFYGVVHNVFAAENHNFYAVTTKGMQNRVFGCSFDDIAEGKMILQEFAK